LELASDLENLSLRPSVVKISWGRPKAVQFCSFSPKLGELEFDVVSLPCGLLATT